MTGPGRVPLLLVCGSPGAGKSSVAWEVYFSLVRQRQSLAHLDLDPVGYGPPGWFGTFEMKTRNMASLWRNYAEVGASAFVVSGVGAVRAEVDACVAAVPGAVPTICMLKVSEAVQRERLLRRAREIYGLERGGASTSMTPGALNGFLEQAAQALREEQVVPGAVTISTDGRSVPDIARDALSLTGWPA